jgi:c-di-GMP-binding flagellar brake protein YcgR
VLHDFGIADPESFALTVANDTPSHISVLLRRLLDQRCLLTAQIGTQAERYTSAILEVSHEGEYLVLDELMPEGHPHLVKDTPIQLRALLDGIEVRFASRIAQIGRQSGLPFYKVPFPSRIDYPQRRQSYRVPVPMQIGLPTSLWLPDERVISGELRDLSPEGIGMRVRLGVPDKTTDSGQVAICQIIIDDAIEFVTDLEVCHIFPPARGKAPRLGGRFVRLRPEQARRIEQFCAELMRRQRRAR